MKQKLHVFVKNLSTFVTQFDLDTKLNLLVSYGNLALAEKTF